jgi:hypothetical protein
MISLKDVTQDYHKSIFNNQHSQFHCIIKIVIYGLFFPSADGQSSIMLIGPEMEEFTTETHWRQKWCNIQELI